MSNVDMNDAISQVSCFRMCYRVTLHLLIMIVFVASFLFFNFVDKAGGYWYPNAIAEPNVKIKAQNCMVHLLHTD
jgi:hypothetical protein